MKYLPHLLLTVVVALAAFVSVSYLIVSDDYGKGRSLARWLLFEMRRSEALQHRLVEISHAMKIKRAVIDDLLAKRLTLPEAVEAFRQADELIDEDSRGLIAPYHTARTDAEVRRQVLAWTASQLGEDPRQIGKILQRLSGAEKKVN